MAKKFMYVCFGILALVVAFHLGAQHGQAGLVDQSGSGIVAIDESCSWVLLNNGEVWQWPTRPFENPDWSHQSYNDLPLPSSNVVMWCANFFVDTSGDGWILHHTEGWMNVGQPPGGPSPARSLSANNVETVRYL